jgi:hypothetical protein
MLRLLLVFYEEALLFPLPLFVLPILEGLIFPFNLIASDKGFSSSDTSSSLTLSEDELKL